MNTLCSFQHATEIMRRQTGLVVPVCFPPGLDVTEAEPLLVDNVATCCDQVEDPAMVCLSVDGEQFGAEVAGRISRETGVSCCVASVNMGKLQGAAYGVRYLVERSDPKYIAVIDQDGDHFANELLNFIRVAEHICGETDTDRVMVLGQRISRHRPMGFLRGELEEVADRVLLDALLYNAVTTGRPLAMEYAFALGEFPDFHSGYKVFSRATAEQVFLAGPQLAGVTEACYYRHACEAVMSVESLIHGAYLGVVNRRTLNEQPISTFGLLERSRLVADKMIWPCRRLNVPLPFVKQWLANHITRVLLNTYAPDGKEELEKIRQMVIAGVAGDETVDSGTLLQPLFV